MDRKAKPRRALVTGATGGLGRAIALELARSGHSLLLHHRSHEAGAVALADEARALGAEAETYRADLERPEEVRDLFDRVSAEGGVDILVHTVGIFLIRSLADTSFEDWGLVLRNNLDPLFLCVHAALPGMRERGWGRIVTFTAASAEGAGGARHMGAYMAAKAAVLSFTRTLALEEAASGITVNAIAPGIMDTPGAGPGVRRNPEKFVPMGRLGEPVEAARAVEFLCRDESGYITGAHLPVAGGYGL